MSLNKQLLLLISLGRVRSLFGHISGRCHIWRKPNTGYQQKHLIPACGGGVMIYFAATRPGHLAVIKSTMNSYVYQHIIESKVRPPV